MSEPLNATAPAASPEPVTGGTTVVSNEVQRTDAVLAKLKELLKVASHDVEAVFDDAANLAKKLV